MTPSSAEVRREWRQIDILVLDELHLFALVVENKVNIEEHSDQLRRYHDVVASELPKFQRRLFIYLTPDGDEPSHEGYVPLAYTDIAQLLDRLLKARRSGMGEEVRIFIRHYKEMIERHVAGDSEVERVCRRIYQNHRRALDLIFEYRPDQQAEVREVLAMLIAEDKELASDRSTKTLIRFLPESLDGIPKVGNWTGTGRVLLFEFLNGRDVHLQLYLGPGAAAIREQIYEVARANPRVFNKAGRALTPEWRLLMKHKFASESELAGLSPEELREVLSEKLKAVKQQRIAPIVEALVDVDWKVAAVIGDVVDFDDLGSDEENEGDEV